MSVDHIQTLRRIVRDLDELGNSVRSVRKARDDATPESIELQAMMGYEESLAGMLREILDITEATINTPIVQESWPHSGELTAWNSLVGSGRPALDMYWLSEQAILMTAGLSYSEIYRLHPVVVPLNADWIRIRPAQSFIVDLSWLRGAVQTTAGFGYDTLLSAIKLTRRLAQGNIAAAADASFMDGTLLGVFVDGVDLAAIVSTIGNLSAETMHRSNDEGSVGQISVEVALATIDTALREIRRIWHSDDN